MANSLEESLGRVLDAYDSRLSADTAREKKSKDDGNLFLARFVKMRSEVVRPVLERAGALLAARGHAFEISEEEFEATIGKVREAGITLHIVPVGMAAPTHAGGHDRSLSIITRHYNKTVWVSSGRPLDAGGIAGPKGTYPIERIDRQFVEEEVLKLVGAVMAY